MSEITIHDYLWASFLGLIQGLTEFWPISSSGHLLLIHEFTDFFKNSSLTFDVALHFGTLLAIVVFFRRDLLRYFFAFLGSFIRPNLRNNTDQRLAWYLFFGSFPAGIVGFLFRDTIATTFRSVWVVVFTLAFFGVVFLIVERYFLGTREMQTVSLFDALFIGVAQALSLVPGVSRSGITIIAGIVRGLKREEAARFSFLLSTPIVFLATAGEMFTWYKTDFSSKTFILALVGFVVSFASGLFAVRFLLSFLRKYSLRPFGYYRIVFAIILFFVLFSRV